MKVSSDISKFKSTTISSLSSPPLSVKDDYTLWQEFKCGCRTSFSVIYHRYFSDLYYYGLKISGDEELSKDCLQELFVSLWHSKEKLSDVTSIKFYLVKSFRRSLINYLKKNKKEGLLKLDFKKHQPNIVFSSEEFIVAEETFNVKKEHLAKILNALPKRRKEAVYLKYYKELSYEQIAVIMNLSEKAVINHVYKAIKSIKKSSDLNLRLKSLLSCLFFLY